MKTSLLVLCITCSLTVSTEFAVAWDHPEKVRLGNTIIQPGTSKIELLESAGEPLMKEDTGINLNTGNYKEIWYYEKGNETLMIHIEGGKVRKVEF